MKQDSGDIPVVACTLSDAELREREATFLAQFRSAVIATAELPDGYAFGIPGDAKGIAVVAELIVAERECCPFLTFELAAYPNMGPVIVRVTGPAGTKDFLRTILCKPEAYIDSQGKEASQRKIKPCQKKSNVHGANLTCDHQHRAGAGR